MQKNIRLLNLNYGTKIAAVSGKTVITHLAPARMRLLNRFLGYMYAQKQDYAKAMKWFRIAADKGDAFAQGWIGMMYHSGLGVKNDGSEAEKWYRLAADQGEHAAQANLGVLYASRQNWAEAYFWYSLSAPGNFNPKTQAASHLTPEQKTAVDKRISDWKPAK
jgi:TPR repeat protein